MELEKLEKYIAESNLDQVTYALAEIGERRQTDVLPFLLSQLKETNNHMLRNEIALALRDIGSQEAVEHIIEMIKNPKTLGYRGTLLYALEPFDCSEYIEELFDCLIDGNFEVSRQALILIEPIFKKTSNSIIQGCVSKVKEAIEKLEEKQNFLIYSLDVLGKSDNVSGD